MTEEINVEVTPATTTEESTVETTPEVEVEDAVVEEEVASDEAAA